MNGEASGGVDSGADKTGFFNFIRTENPNSYTFDETTVKYLLTEWLEGIGGCKVFWEKKNSKGKPTFEVVNRKERKGTVEKPDLLIKAFVQDGERGVRPAYYLCEVKDSKHNSNVYDSFPQIIKYASGEFDFFIEGSRIYPDGFLVATQESTRGHLFSSDYDVLMKDDDFSAGRRAAIVAGHLPPHEYSMTEEYTRLLWRMAEQLDIENVKIGVLLCGVDRRPLFQYKVNFGDVARQGVEQWRR